MKVEDQLIFLNQKAGLNFADIADAVGCSERTLNNIKNTGSGRSKTLLQIDEMYKHYFLPDSANVREKPTSYGGDLEKLLGKVLIGRAFMASLDEGFSSVDDFVRYVVRKEVDTLDLKRMSDRSKLPAAQPSPDEPAGDVAQRMIDQKEKD